MARGTYQAGSVSVNLNANSAQYVQAMQKAQQLTQACLGNMSNAFKQYAGVAMNAGAAVGRVTAQLGTGLLKGASIGAGALSAYTGIVVAHRLEQNKLAIQYGATAEQMNQMAYVANYAGVELEDALDAMKEFSIKAGDAVEAGGAVTNTMSAFYKAAGGADKWNAETNPVTKINMLREAFQKLSSSDKIRVLDEAGDAGLRLNGILQLTNEQFEMLQKTGAATATAANMQNVQELISKFGYLQQIGNDFLMGVIGRLSPVFSKVVDEWTTKLKTAFEGRGGFKEGFQSYVDDWANKIFKFLMDTISSVASFVDTLRNLSNNLLGMYNSTLNAAGSVFSVGAEAKTFNSNNLPDKERKEFETMEKDYRAYDKNTAIYHSTRAQIEHIENTIGKDKAQSDAKYIKLVKDMNAAEQKVNEYTASGKLEKYKETVHVLNAKEQADRDPHAVANAAKNMVVDPATKAFNDQMNNKPKEDDAPKGHKPKSLTHQVYDASQSGAAAKQSDNWDAFNKKLEAQKQKVLEIMKTYNTKELSEIEKREADEKRTLNDAYKGMKDIVTDYYVDKLKTLNKNSPAYVQATKEMNAKVKAIEEERHEAIKRLDEHQQKRRILDLNNMTKDFDRRKKAMERQYGYGAGANETESQARNREISDQYDEMLEEMREKYGKHLDDQNSMEYQKFKELQDEKQKALDEAAEAEMERFWEQQQAKDTIGNMIGNIKGQGESPFPGTSNKDVENAKTNVNDQVKMTVQGADTILAHAAKNNKKAFELKKKMDIATAIMATYNGATRALEWGWPLGPIFAGLTIAMGLMNVAQIRSQQWTGQAHDGIDYVPNEGTWNLQKGERVMGAALNQDMTQFLKDNKDGVGSKGALHVQYHQTVQGNVLINDEYENDLMERNASFLYSKMEEIRQDRGL